MKISQQTTKVKIPRSRGFAVRNLCDAMRFLAPMAVSFLPWHAGMNAQRDVRTVNGAIRDPIGH